MYKCILSDENDPIFCFLVFEITMKIFLDTKHGIGITLLLLMLMIVNTTILYLINYQLCSYLIGLYIS